MKLYMTVTVITEGFKKKTFTLIGDVSVLDNTDETYQLVLDIEHKLNEIGRIRVHTLLED